MTPRTFERYVALGDSTTEGLDDPDGAGGYRGWANRLAERIAAHQGSLDYANLGVRGRCARQIKEEQLGPALALRPDLATVVAGMNDLLRGGFDARAIAEDVGDMQRALIDRGCVVLTFTLPDISRRLAKGPFARLLSRRTLALDDELRRVVAGLRDAPPRSGRARAGDRSADVEPRPPARERRGPRPDRRGAGAAARAPRASTTAGSRRCRRRRPRGCAPGSPRIWRGAATTSSRGSGAARAAAPRATTEPAKRPSLMPVRAAPPASER